MLVKIYLLVWGFFALAVLLLFLSKNLTTLGLVWLGFVAFGLTFMGMMGVLPTVVSHPTPPKAPRARPVVIQEMRETTASRFHIFKSA